MWRIVIFLVDKARSGLGSCDNQSVFFHMNDVIHDTVEYAVKNLILMSMDVRIWHLKTSDSDVESWSPHLNYL